MFAFCTFWSSQLDILKAERSHVVTYELSSNECREEDDLATGGVMKAVVHAGQGNEAPRAGDLVRYLWIL